MAVSIQILLASYNGECFIERQLESLLVQNYRDWELLLSDDLSQDATTAIVARYAEHDKRIRDVANTEAHGNARDNFFSLVDRATAPYIAFCDQDDVWLVDKLEREIKEMHCLEERYGKDVPLLVFSDLAVVDESLEVIASSFQDFSGLNSNRVSLANLLAQNVSPGCVMLVNRALYHDTLRLPKIRSSIIMHDWWFMLTAAAFGHIGYVSEATMLYRQHGNNSVGASSASATGILQKLGNYVHKLLPSTQQLDSVDARVRQAAAFLQCYGEQLDTTEKDLCQGMAELLGFSPLKRLSWCHMHDVLNATVVMRAGMDWELALYEVGRKAEPEIKPRELESTDLLDKGDRLVVNSRVAVVMSTYNGEKYLAEQIDSVLAQDKKVDLFVRDDGSTDSTLELLEAYAAKGLLQYKAGENKGVVGSFFDALTMPDDSYDFVAFCDQDDAWHTDKISRAVRMIAARDQSVPQLYCSEYNFCDEDMNFIARSQLNRIGVSLPTLLVESVCSGNTSLMNRTLVQELLANGSEGVYTHDWWMALVAAGLGEIYFDDFASLDYRRLTSSVSPTGSGGLALLAFRIKTFLGKGQLSEIKKQLKHFKECYAQRLDADDLAMIDCILDGKRLSKTMFAERLRQKPTEELAVRLLFLLGLL
ncbi:glycosyltransferase [Atopobium sp. oral taxon 810]|uniref:glycosyltransferase n=1 Tax=Atopobium sp. oral taxon 810 TaxID=712158 RepID=UPI000397B68D|nr:glycosyltransferase [Atopobium sp. oral taxon 810]ERI04552.1 glycosyltransferase, group 2 family protein [Atopobium sp. oral taxon 810 str. F0209]